jgi:tryptophan synthase beta chain
LHPGTHQPVGPDDLAPLFPMDLILQEVSTERYIPIPDEVQDIYRLWRPSPLYRAHRLEQALGTPARIYYKYEGVSPAGSHKPNTAVPQVYYNAKAGVKKLTTETGAGQWGAALAFACSLFDVECEVWQVGASYDAKPYRRTLIETFGGTVHRSPSRLTSSGRSFPADHPGSLGIAISEAVEVAAAEPDTKYALGSVLNHVLLHQTIIGEEALLQLAMAGDPAPTWWWTGLPVPPGEARRPAEPDDSRGGAGVLPIAHQRRIPLRLRRHGGFHPVDEDAHPRTRLRTGPDPRRRIAVSRHGAVDLTHL